MTRVSHCPNCESANQYRTVKQVASGGGHAPNFLPGLGTWLVAGKFDIVVCRDCGLTRWFASEEARRKLGESERWTRV